MLKMPAITTEKIEKTDEEYERLEKRLAELEAEEEQAERVQTGREKHVESAKGGKENVLSVFADHGLTKQQVGDQDEEREDEEEDDEEEDEEEGEDVFESFYANNEGDESVSDEGEEEQPEEEGDEEESMQTSKQLKSVHLRTKTPPHPTRKLQVHISLPFFSLLLLLPPPLSDMTSRVTSQLKHRHLSQSRSSRLLPRNLLPYQCEPLRFRHSSRRVGLSKSLLVLLLLNSSSPHKTFRPSCGRLCRPVS